MNKKNILILIAFLVLGVGGLVLGMNMNTFKEKYLGIVKAKSDAKALAAISDITSKVVPKEGFTLPVSWGDYGPRLVEAGVIDLDQFEKAVQLTDEQRKILTEGSSENLKIDANNSQFVVDFLWALGLAQKSIVYDKGPLGTDYKGQEGSFASTGGWTLARGDAVNYLNKFDLIPLTAEQQDEVTRISKGVYRPCCDNPTWFPDCNHGMAALAAIELLVSKGILENDIYRYILDLNSFWFSQTYITNAYYMKTAKGLDWDKVDAKEMLGKAFSSYTGASDIAKKVGPLPQGATGGGSCGT